MWKLPLRKNYTKNYRGIFVPVYKEKTNFRTVFTQKNILSKSADVTFVLGILTFCFFCIYPAFSYFLYNPVSAKLVKPFEGTSLSQDFFSDEDRFFFRELNLAQDVVKKREANSPNFFKLSIPKLKIENAFVEIDSNTLDPREMLGHYKGTSLPGEAGNSFIYGHSSLPFLYNPKNYSTIFTKITELEIGDNFYVEIQNKILTYEIVFIKEMLPKEVNPYSLYYTGSKYAESASSVTLMTCTPAGTTKNRYIVVGRLAI
ncbi:sortase [Patescibacteria group bacterium]|nr:sortase [Patescibacteria group bacterium]